jgi:acyl-CoA thioesterase FadM
MKLTLADQAHVNNVNYYRYAESARVNWITNFAVHVDPAHRKQWRELMSPISTGLIMRSLKADFKFVRHSLVGSQ